MKITAPGVYDIEIERYHRDAQLCDGPSISSSGLREIINCPAKYFAFSPYNPSRFPDESTKALDIGKAAHCLTLGEPEFARYFFVSPHDRFNANPGKQWYDGWKLEVEAGREKRTLLKPDEFETVLALSAAQKRSAQVMRAFVDGKPEQSLIWRDKETGIWLRSRPDWLPHKPAERLIVEYKSAKSIEPTAWSRDCFDFGYHLQTALMIDGVQEVLGVKALGVAHVVQEKSPPYIAELRLLAPDQIEWGRKQYRRALHIFAECLKLGEWPGYTRGASYVETPYRVAQDMNIGRTDDFGKPFEAAAE